KNLADPLRPRRLCKPFRAREVCRQTISDEKCEGTRTARLHPRAREITDVQRLNPILSASEGSKYSARNSASVRIFPSGYSYKIVSPSRKRTTRTRVEWCGRHDRPESDQPQMLAGMAILLVLLFSLLSLTTLDGSTWMMRS